MSRPNALQQEKQLIDPFEISEDQILERVYMTHYHCVEKYDVASLYNVATDVINHSVEISELIVKGRFGYFREDTTYFPRFPALKRIACQMICTARGEQYAHHTTMLILEQLKSYSWDAKAVIVQAAFALEYGKFWHLPLGQQDQLGNSLAELNGLQSIQENSQSLIQFSKLVKKAKQLIESITEWKRITSAGYDTKDVPALSHTLQEIPVVVFWTIMTFVTCTSHIDFMGDKSYRYELSKFDQKLDIILIKFNNLLEECNKQRVAIEEYRRRRLIVTQTQTNKDIVKFLKALLIPSDSKSIVYNGLTGEQVRIEEFKKKHVLLFISGLENIDEDIQLLKSIHEKLKEGPYEVEGYRKEDFKILWVPIADEWNDKHRKTLERTKVGWYVVKHFNFKTGITLIREVFNYKDTSIVPLISPEGKIINYDAKKILTDWGIEGFPFRTTDHARLTQQWDWFWTEIINLSPGIKESKEEDNYIFIYGGNDKWVQEFSAAVGKFKSEVIATLEDTAMDSYAFGKDDPKIVPRFWIGIDNLLASRKLKKGGEGMLDSATTHIKRLISLKQDSKGWAILSKGSNVKLMGQGEAMLRTVSDFEIWKDKLQQEMSFDVAFKEYYETKVKDAPHKCASSEYPNYPTDILARISCPNLTCGRVMEVSSVKYKCCHGRENDAPVSGGTLPNYTD